MTQQSKTVLVTGGAGYVGSHTCKALAQAGFTPVVYDSLCRGNAWAVKWGPLEVGDLMDGERLRDVIRAYRPLGVIHFAALAYVGESMSEPLLYYRNNVGGTITLLRAMAAEGVDRLVFSSTCATYGTPETNPIREDMPQSPINPYGQSKLVVEQILRDCAHKGGLSAVALRYFNAAGADVDCEIGEAHDPETHLIPLALGAAQGTVPALTVFGDDHDTPDGTCIRDYIHVADLADAHLRALSHTGVNAGFSAFNLGTGTGISIKELIAAAQEVTGRAVPFSYGPRRAGDPAALVADPTLALDTLGWKADHSDLRNILSTAWAWMERAGMKASVLILTYNEEINIRRCLESLQGFDDVVVVDSGSTDNTCAIAAEMGARILTRPFDNFATQRNFGLDVGAMKHVWVLHLDADETLTPEFRAELDALAPTDALDGWRVPSKTMLNGRWLKHAGMYPTYQVRLGHRERLRFRQVGHGQREDCPPHRVGTFPEPYLHYNFSHGLAKWFAKHVRYAEDEAHQMAAEVAGNGAGGRLWSGDATERRRTLKRAVNRLPVWLRPPLRFLQVLVLRRGVLDGRAGLQYALMLSAYEAMIASFSLSRDDPARGDGL